MDASSFLRSAITVHDVVQELDEVTTWLRERRESPCYRVERTPLDGLDEWSLDDGTGDILHKSGRFFRIHGLRIQAETLECSRHWEQPIIDQPEVGILGIISQVIDGTRCFLVQAKMEPGNCNLVQLAPTVQATRSNFTCVHKGRVPLYFESFRDPSHRILVDQLQSEHGSRFLRKRNRNMVIEVEGELPLYPGFFWLTLGQLRCLLQSDDIVNMDLRSVLSCIPMFAAGAAEALQAVRPQGGFARDVFDSYCDEDRSLHSDAQLMSWFSEMKTRYQMRTAYLPLNRLHAWKLQHGTLRHERGGAFDVIGIHVRAEDREVPEWSQPILGHRGTGLLCFLAKRIRGVLHVLVQARVEAGNLDVVEMAPTVCLPGASEAGEPDPPFASLCRDASADRIRYSAIQSEEGGRLFHMRSHYRIVECGEDEVCSVPDNYAWMTLGQIERLLAHSYYFNVEARSLLCGLALVDRRNAR